MAGDGRRCKGSIRIEDDAIVKAYDNSALSRPMPHML
jgi:hypothetical protein